MGDPGVLKYELELKLKLTFVFLTRLGFSSPSRAVWLGVGTEDITS